SEEAIEIITRLWTEERVTFSGEFYRLEDATCEPKPAQKPRPPIWWAGGVRSIPRAARYAEYFVNFRPSFESIRTELVPLLAAENEKQGTRTKLACWVYCHVTPGRELSAEQIDAQFAGYYFTDPPPPREVTVAGSPEQCAAELVSSRGDQLRLGEQPHAHAGERTRAHLGALRGGVRGEHGGRGPAVQRDLDRAGVVDPPERDPPAELPVVLTVRVDAVVAV